MRHLETSASGPARRFVQAFWQSTGFIRSPMLRRVLPDACADFIFDLSDATRPTRESAVALGTMTRAILVEAQGARDLFGVRFRPAAVSLLWPMPMNELCDSRTALDDVAPDGSALADCLCQTQDFQTRVALAEAWIESRLGVVDLDAAKLTAIAAINARLEEGASPNALADFTGWNERKLQRFFNSTYGATSATLHCFWRYEAVRRALVSGAAENLCALADRHGYADQAHMAREFRRFAGLSINAWRAEARA